MATPLPANATSTVEEAVHNSHFPGILGCTIICGTVALVSTGLRLYSRLASSKRLYLNDWLFLLALCFFLPYDAIFAVTAARHDRLSDSPGKDPADARLSGILRILNQNLYFMTMAYLKFSLLTLYDECLSASRNFRRCLLIIGIFTAAWVTSSVVVTSIQCKPIEFTWDSSIKDGQCLHYSPFNMVMTGLNVISSLAMLVIPVPMVLRMDLSKRKKILLLVAFCIGATACVIGVVRFTFSLNGTDRTKWDSNLPFDIASTIELTLSIICASLPAYSYFFPGFNLPPPRRRFTTGCGTQHLHPRTPAHISVHITGGATMGPRRSGIAVTDDISMMTHTHVNGAWVRVPDQHEDDESALVSIPMVVYKSRGSESEASDGL